ncbi:MAG TPA: P-loop NTPase [Anaeromyxobacteraceae bacterium]|nr:P-loop NTPase [Anaeromyxobacteraceae bacterium]
MPDAQPLQLVPTDPRVPRRAPVRALPRPPRIVSVGGGKGGIGKSLVAANLAIALARRGERVVLVDADLAGANLHTCLGLELPGRGLADVLERRAELAAVAVPTCVPGVRLVAGAMDHPDATNPKLAQKARLVKQLQTLDADRVVIDLGAGTHLHVLDLFLVSEQGLLVLVPEPSAVENVYRFVKAAFWRRVRHAVSAHGCEAQLRAVIGEGTFRSPAEILGTLSARHPQSGAVLARELIAFRPRLVVNQTRTPQDEGVGPAVIAAWRKFFGLGMDYLGHVPHEGEMWRAMRARRPLLVHAPEAPASLSFAHIAEGLAALEAAEVHSGRTT